MKKVIMLALVCCASLIVSSCGDFVTTNDVLKFNDSMVTISAKHDKPIEQMTITVVEWLKGNKVDITRAKQQHAACEKAYKRAMEKVNALATPNAPECHAFKKAYVDYINSSQDYITTYSKAIQLMEQHNPAKANITMAIDAEMNKLEQSDLKHHDNITKTQNAMAKKYNFELR